MYTYINTYIHTAVSWNGSHEWNWCFTHKTIIGGLFANSLQKATNCHFPFISECKARYTCHDLRSQT